MKMKDGLQILTYERPFMQCLIENMQKYELKRLYGYTPNNEPVIIRVKGDYLYLIMEADPQHDRIVAFDATGCVKGKSLRAK